MEKIVTWDAVVVKERRPRKLLLWKERADWLLRRIARRDSLVDGAGREARKLTVSGGA